jgi:DNA-binding NarL/FixJ family response regulator
MISVVLADDNPDMLENLREELDGEFKILGFATNGEEAFDLVMRLEPDVAVLDITMPVMTGLEVATRLRECHSRSRIVFVTIHEAPEYVVAGLSAGALGYVTKRRLSSDLARAIREVFDGRTYLSPSLKR